MNDAALSRKNHSRFHTEQLAAKKKQHKPPDLNLAKASYFSKCSSVF